MNGNEEQVACIGSSLYLLHKLSLRMLTEELRGPIRKQNCDFVKLVSAVLESSERWLV